MDLEKYARLSLQCLDLTSLGAGDSEESVRALCDRAVGRYGSAAAVCVWPRFVATARDALAGSGVKIATVINFPEGEDNLLQAVLEAKSIMEKGPDEVDFVYPYKEFLAGNTAAAHDITAAIRRECKGKTLKVILETGALKHARSIAAAARDAIEAGADFLKTSTGTVEPGATREAANAILEAIRDCGRKNVGFKASGGISTVEQCRSYAILAESIIGRKFLAPETFRIGASKLLDDIVKTLGYGDK